jgi:hypothetical protein
MDIIKCGHCGKKLNKRTEIEYSSWVNAFFCDPDCAKSFYFEFMHSAPLDISEDHISVDFLEISINKRGYLVEDN